MKVNYLALFALDDSSYILHFIVNLYTSIRKDTPAVLATTEMERGKKRKRNLDLPRITYHASDRTFERLFKGTQLPMDYLV